MTIRKNQLSKTGFFGILLSGVESIFIMYRYGVNMRGSHRVILETEHLKYDFTIKRNITVILGDSATGKTTLVDNLNNYALRGKASGIKLESDVPCYVFGGIAVSWKATLESIKRSIIFIDEGYDFIFSKDFAEFVKEADNYFVLITRQPLYYLPYSTKEIYGIRTSGKFNFPDKVYHEFYPVYPEENNAFFDDNAVLITEDNCSGYEFFSGALSNVKCISSEGNSKIIPTLSTIKGNQLALVIADGAAFGAYIENLLMVIDIRGNTALYLPESFEWLILKSGVLKSKAIIDILEKPEDYIESSEFFSWENFFTYLLEKNTVKDRVYRYSKGKLSSGYLTEYSKKAILSVIPEEIRRMLK